MIYLFKANKPVTTVAPKPTTTAAPKTTTTVKPQPTQGNTSKPAYSVIPGGISGSSKTTRYWDCCKPSCGWNGKAHVTSPVKTCAKNGVTVIHNNIQSGCAAGGSKFLFFLSQKDFNSTNPFFFLKFRCLCL